MLEAIREPLGEPRRALRVPGAHGLADREQIGGEGGRKSAPAPAHQRVESDDGAVEALHGRNEGSTAGSCGGEIDDLSHGLHHEPRL